MTIKNKIEKFRDGELLIYRHSQSSYQGKIYLGYINGQTKFAYKSIKSDDYNFCVKKLKEWFDEIKYKQRNNISIGTKSRENKFIKMIDEYLLSIKDSQNNNDKDGNHYGKRIKEWIKTEKIKEIDYPSLIQLQTKYLPQFNYTLNTIGHYFNFIRKVYRHQREIGKITKKDSPEFPVIKKNVSRRTYFTFNQYRTLINKSIARMNEEKQSRFVQFIRKSLNRFIIFQCGCGLRPDETYNLRFQDLETRVKRTHKKLIRHFRIRVIGGKTGSREVISKPQCYDSIQELKMVYAEYKDVMKERGYDSNMVFPVKFGKSNRELLKSCDLYEDKLTGKKRDIKSYRHTYISWGVINKEDIFQISKNCGNSVQVIQTNYTNFLTSRDFEDDLSSLRIVK